LTKQKKIVYTKLTQFCFSTTCLQQPAAAATLVATALTHYPEFWKLWLLAAQISPDQAASLYEKAVGHCGKRPEVINDFFNGFIVHVFFFILNYFF
jgi:hypothetical protein